MYKYLLYLYIITIKKRNERINQYTKQRPKSYL